MRLSSAEHSGCGSRRGPRDVAAAVERAKTRPGCRDMQAKVAKRKLEDNNIVYYRTSFGYHPSQPTSSSHSPAPRPPSICGFLFLLLLLHPLPIFLSSINIPSSLSLSHHNYGRRCSPSFLFPHDEDHQAWPSLSKSACLPPLHLIHPAHILPQIQDTLDLFATLIVSLQLTTHKQFFRTFPNSFTTYASPPLSHTLAPL
jgi:hypothetical protein